MSNTPQSLRSQLSSLPASTWLLEVLGGHPQSRKYLHPEYRPDPSEPLHTPIAVVEQTSWGWIHWKVPASLLLDIPAWLPRTTGSDTAAIDQHAEQYLRDQLTVVTIIAAYPGALARTKRQQMRSAAHPLRIRIGPPKPTWALSGNVFDLGGLTAAALGFTAGIELAAATATPAVWPAWILGGAAAGWAVWALWKRAGRGALRYLPGNQLTSRRGAAPVRAIEASNAVQQLTDAPTVQTIAREATQALIWRAVDDRPYPGQNDEIITDADALIEATQTAVLAGHYLQISTSHLGAGSPIGEARPHCESTGPRVAGPQSQDALDAIEGLAQARTETALLNHRHQPDPPSHVAVDEPTQPVKETPQS